jgi:predicted transcriptional regulator YheO
MSEYNQDLSDKKTALLLYLEQKGILNELYRYGIITAKPKLQIQSRLKVVALMSQGLSKAEACRAVAGLLGVDKKTIYSYLR